MPVEPDAFVPAPVLPPPLLAPEYVEPLVPSVDPLLADDPPAAPVAEPFALELPLLALVPPLEPADEPELAPAPLPEPAPPPPLWPKTGVQRPNAPSAANRAVTRTRFVLELCEDFMPQLTPRTDSAKWGATLNRFAGFAGQCAVMNPGGGIAIFPCRFGKIPR